MWIIGVQSFICSTPYIVARIKKKFINGAVEICSVFQHRIPVRPYLKIFIQYPESGSIFKHAPQVSGRIGTYPWNIIITLPGLGFIFRNIGWKKIIFYIGITAAIAITSTPDITCPVKIQRNNIIAANTEGV